MKSVSEILITPTELEKGLKPFSIHMHSNGDVSDVKFANFDCRPGHICHNRNLSNILWAKDAETAIKITNELRARLIARGEL